MPTDPPVDPRGLCFSAWITTLVLAVVLATDNALLLGVQALVFALGAFAGLRFSPYGVLYRRLVAPWIAGRFGPPLSKEDAAPSRFAQGVGCAFALIGTVGYGTGLTALGLTATAFALGAAFLMPRSGSASAARSTCACRGRCVARSRPARSRPLEPETSCPGFVITPTCGSAVRSAIPA